MIFLVISLLIMMSFRVLSLLVFGNWNELAGHRGELGNFFLLGLRFDLKIAAMGAIIAYWLPTVLVGVWIKKPEKLQRFIRLAFSCLLVILLLLGFIDFGYQTFFGNPIDVMILGLIHDDTLAIADTLVTDWRLILLNLAFIGVSVVTVFVFLRLTDKPLPKASGPARFAATQIVLLILFALFARGSLDTFPLRGANASVGDSRFINSLIMNSTQNLQHAIEDRGHTQITRSSQNILREAKVANPLELYKLAGYNSEADLMASTSAKKGRLPHVVFVQMEGWSTEIILGQSERNQVLGEFAKHMGEDHFYRYFFSNAYGTNPTIEALLLNSPITPLSQSPAQKTRFSMSNAWPFKRAGYRTAFISGGDSAWRNHEKFWTQQGFDSYTGRASIEKKYHVDASDNPWGVYEEFVFAALEDKIKEADADGVPLFAYVLTTNNHSPVRLPKTYTPPPLDPSAYGFQPNDANRITDLTGFNYQTDQFGKFISWVKSGDLKNRIIVAATGDHVRKGFTDYSTSERTYLRYSVPAYFYVPPTLDQLKKVPNTITGSHEDIFPTLFELALPEAHYFRFGTPLMQKDPAHAYGWVETRDFLFPDGVSNIQSQSLLPWADARHVLLSGTSRPAADWEKAIMARQKNRKLLEEWLLSRDCEKQVK